VETISELGGWRRINLRVLNLKAVWDFKTFEHLIWRCLLNKVGIFSINRMIWPQNYCNLDIFQIALFLRLNLDIILVMLGGVFGLLDLLSFMVAEESGSRFGGLNRL
jgi:hypothetical protein